VRVHNMPRPQGPSCAYIIEVEMPFACNICEEESTRICVQCTKDTCSNHLCDKCGACSDCCDCELKLDEEPVDETEHVFHTRAESNGAGVNPFQGEEPE